MRVAPAAEISILGTRARPSARPYQRRSGLRAKHNRFFFYVGSGSAVHVTHLLILAIPQALATIPLVVGKCARLIGWRGRRRFPWPRKDSFSRNRAPSSTRRLRPPFH